MAHYQSEQRAKIAAEFLRQSLKINDANQPEIGLVLGTGWGDTLEFDAERCVSFADIPGFSRLDGLEGHAREVVCGTLSGRNFVALRGRVHANERSADPELNAMVRLQMEMLICLGVKKFIVTSAVGSLSPSIGAGDVVMVNGFVTLFAPEMPLFAGEFCSPEDTIDQPLISQIFRETTPGFVKTSLKVYRGGHAMVRGPFFEGRKYDKDFLAKTGAAVVGMSILPEACVVAVYPGVKIVPLGFVTNTASEEHSHEENMKRAKEKSVHLGEFLNYVAGKM